MIKIENVVTPSPEQWEAVIRGMRNPMNSWDRSDSEFERVIYDSDLDAFDSVPEVKIGDDDMTLMEKLISAGTDHRKFMRMIPVHMDITAPLYWWKEFDTYKVGTVANSCSTMHKIHAKEFTLDDFSHERMGKVALAVLQGVVDQLNDSRRLYNETKDVEHWDDMIQLLPSSFNQRRTVVLNYEVLRNMNKSRRNHKLDEWVEFCERLWYLPYPNLIKE